MGLRHPGNKLSGPPQKQDHLIPPFTPIEQIDEVNPFNRLSSNRCVKLLAKVTIGSAGSGRNYLYAGSSANGKDAIQQTEKILSSIVTVV